MDAIALSAPGAIDEDGGGRDRLARLFDAQHRRLFRFAVRLARNDEEARDLVQEAFLRAAREPRRIPGNDEQAGAWLVRIVVNLAHDHHRRIAVRETFRRLFLREDRVDPAAALDAAGAVRNALGKLPPRQRAIVALYELEGVSTAEVAATLGITEVTVRWHLATARKRLAVLLAPITEAGR